MLLGVVARARASRGGSSPSATRSRARSSRWRSRWRSSRSCPDRCCPIARPQHAAVALVALGIAIAVVRRAAIFQALGFLVAENGLYLAALVAPGGLPAVIELGLVFDLVVVVVVAAAFSAKIHEQLGTGDTCLLGELRD